MRILLLTQYYPPEPVLKFADLARGLRERGHEVQVITGFPCYPAGKIYAGHRQRIHREEHVDGVLVTRIPQFPDHSRSVVRRALYYLSFALSAATIGLWRSQQADVILVYHSALPTALAAWFISRVKRVPYVLDIADLWPESVAASGMLRSPILLALIRAGMKFAYRGAARINVITEGYVERLVSLGVPRAKMSLVHFWFPAGQCDPAPCDGTLMRQEQLDGRFNVIYSGTMGPLQDLGAVIEAAALLLHELPHVQFVMIGDGLEHDALVALAEQRRATNVRFLGRRSPDEVRRLHAVADALLVHLKPGSLSRISIPSKTFACMAAGRPIVMAVEGESSRLIESHTCGITAEPSNPQDLADAVRRFVAMPESERQQMAAAAVKAYRENYSSEIQIPKFERLLSEAIGGDATPRSVAVADRHPKTSFYRSHGKRLVDLFLALPMLFVASPLMLLIAIAVRVSLGPPIFFKQDRPGCGGRLFKLRKFRTMRESHEPSGSMLGDAERLTRFGQFLRANSLDELPELWNVVRGEMSLVGPRPLLPEYLSRYTPQQARRHDIRPGITGWAQVNGRNELAWEDRFEHDLWYVDHCGVRLDIKILLKTAWQVIRRRGITTAGHATAAPFKGDRSQPETRRTAAANTRDKSIIVLGAGGHAKVVISTLRAAGWHVEAAYDDDATKYNCRILGVEVRGSIADLSPQMSANAVIAVGDGEQRRAIAMQFAFSWVSVVHPAAWVDPSVNLGPGVVICAGAVVQPGCRIGRHAIINTLAGVDHDCRIGDFAHIGPGAHLAGGVRVGEGTLIGTGASAVPGATIGDVSVVGAGATIVDDLPDGILAVGCPARVIKNLLPESIDARSAHQAA